jgi:uncharacterized protein (DUF2252 family)
MQADTTAPLDSASNRRLPLRTIFAQGKALRSVVPRRALGDWEPAAHRPDPLQLLAASNEGRLPDLVPIRYGRMRHSAFTFLRGSPSIMAYDVGTGNATTGVYVQACGDCHLENFGIFATPERNVVFDINDFDETLPAPWEWDVKRLAASVHVAARVGGASEADARAAVGAAARAYRERMGECASMTTLEVWYSRIDAAEVFERTQAASLKKGATAQSAPDDTHELIAEQYTEGEGLGRRIVDKPPKLFHPPPDREVVIDARSVLERYRGSLREDIATLLDSYELVDMAVKVVGIGSVGTRCAVALLMAHENDGLILQIKEARNSVLEPYARRCEFDNQGRRVIAGQRIMQTASDMFLGWSDSEDGHHFYVRQLSDVKGAVDATALSGSKVAAYAALCGQALALSHARSGDSGTLAGYLGTSNSFERAIVRFAESYAATVEADYAIFMAAIESGAIDARDG